MINSISIKTKFACHKVIRADGDLGGFSSLGGISLKKKLLDFEKN